MTFRGMIVVAALVDGTHSLDESVTSSDGSSCLKRAAELNKKELENDQSIRCIHHNLVCCRPVEQSELSWSTEPGRTVRAALCNIFERPTVRNWQS